MKKAVVVTAIVVSLLIWPTSALAHHVGNAEDSMPADQWLYVDSVAHGEAADGNSEMDEAPGTDAATETMSGQNNWLVTGEANMNTP